jgi:ABC-type transport system substrate-binding protein
MKLAYSNRHRNHHHNPHLEHSFLLSRRAFLQTMALLGGSAGLGSLAACTAPQIMSGGAPAAQPAPSGPQVGGRFRLAYSGDLRTFDPPGAEGYAEWWSAGMLLFNRLYFYDSQGTFYPDLAADLPTLSEDGRVYAIPLRPGVRFHNGRELTAADVKFSLERQLWPEVFSWGKSYMERIAGYQAVIDGTAKELAGIRIVDDYHLEITLSQPHAVFPALLGLSPNGIVPREECLQAGDDWGHRVVIGTGPFTFVEWLPGERAVFARNPDYFKPGLPYLEQIELAINVDPAVQMLRWENGELEWVQNIPPAELPRLLGDGEFMQLLRMAPSVATIRLGIHLNTPPFDDLRVRQAVAMAIDREAIERQRGGLWAPMEGYISAPMLQHHADFKSNFPYDPARASALLAEAGYADGIQGVTLFSARFPEVGEVLQADLKAIGIETELAVGPRAEWRDRIRAGETALFLDGWWSSFPDAFDVTSVWATCASIETGSNDGFYCNERVDELFAQIEALPLTDPARIAGYREIEEIIINQDVAWVGLCNPQNACLGVNYIHDDVLDTIYGWPRLDTAWSEQA